jgi:hypothetical protein
MLPPDGKIKYYKLRYRSTELLLSDANYGKPVDMWAIACIMGELIGNIYFLIKYYYYNL